MQWLKITNPLSHKLRWSGIWEWLSWVWVWLRISCEVAVRMLTVAAEREGLTWAGDLHPRWHTHVAAGRRPRFLTLWNSPQAAWESSCHGSWLPPEWKLQVREGKRTSMKPQTLYSLVSKVTYYVLYFICWKQIAESSPHLRGISLHF